MTTKAETAECVGTLKTCIGTVDAYRADAIALHKETADLKTSNIDLASKLDKEQHPFIPKWVEIEVSFIFGFGLGIYGLHKLGK
jgi:hypothetical protein